MSDDYTLASARADHAQWFAPPEMRWFGSRIGQAYSAGAAVYVCTSEQPPHAPRSYNVRRFDSADTDTIGPSIIDGWGSRSRSQSVARNLAAAERDGWIGARADRHDTYRACRACDGDNRGWAQFEVTHPTDPGMSGDYCAAHLPAVIGYA